MHIKDWLPKCCEALVVSKMKEDILNAGTKYQIGGLPNHRVEEHLIVVKAIILLLSVLLKYDRNAQVQIIIRILLLPSSCLSAPAPSSCSLPAPLARPPSLSSPPATHASPPPARPRLAVLVQASLNVGDGAVPVLGGSGKIYFEGFLFS